MTHGNWQVEAHEDCLHMEPCTCHYTCGADGEAGSVRCERDVGASVRSLTNVRRKMTVMAEKIVNRGWEDTDGQHVS